MSDLAQMESEGRRFSDLLDKAVTAFRESVQTTAEAEREYRKAKAMAWVQQETGTAQEKLAHVDAACADLRYQRDLAEGMKEAAKQAIAARRTQISLIQSVLSAHRAEAEFARTAPR